MSDTIHVVCPNCDAVNRIPCERPTLKAVCGQCRAKLFEGQPIELDGRRFDRHTQRNDIPVIVDFWAPWCGPCHAMVPILNRAAQELEPHARFVKINADDNPELSGRLGVQGIPACLCSSTDRCWRGTLGSPSSLRFRIGYGSSAVSVSIGAPRQTEDFHEHHHAPISHWRASPSRDWRPRPASERICFKRRPQSRSRCVSRS